ncbi:MAG: ribosome-binding factor A [Alphaproteobacteria bacterium]|nr:ribosome-binding factor A [Alphaproteobacteria bacterium]
MTRSRSGRSASLRQLRVGEEIRHLLAGLLANGELHDPALQGLSFTVTEVTVSPDFANATVYVTPFVTKETLRRFAEAESASPKPIFINDMPAHAQAEAIFTRTRPALMRAAPFMRSQLARQLTLRQTPRLTFAFDTAFDYASKMANLFESDHVAQDLDSVQA